MSDQGGQRKKARVVFWIAALGAASFWMLLVWAIHRDSPRTLVSFHGFIHAAIAERFLDSARVSFPPENPFFAGQPVCYYWFFQFLAAQLVRLLGWNVFHAMEAIILAATGVLMIVAVALGRTLYRSVAAGVLMGYLVMAGTNPLGWIFAVVKIIAKGTRVLLDNDPNYLWGVVHPIYSLIRYNDVGGVYGPLLNFFLNMTSRPAALASLMVLVFCLEWSLRRRSLLARISLGGASALTTALSPIHGIPAGAMLIVAMELRPLLSLVLKHFAPTRTVEISPGKDTVPHRYASLAIVVGILVAAPTYYHLLFGPSANHVQFSLLSAAGLRHLATVVSSAFLLLFLAVVGLVRAPQDQRPFLGTLVLSALMLLAASAAFLIPPGNESNFFHAAVVLLAVPGAASILRVGAIGGRSTASPSRLAGIILVFLPTLLMLLAAYVHRPSLPLEFQATRPVRSQDSNLAHLYQWVQNKTSPDSIFIVDPGSRVAVCGNTSEFPAMTGRVIFTEEQDHYLVEPYPDSKRRVDIAVRLASGKEPIGTDRAYLQDFHRPSYIVSYLREDRGVLDRMERLYGSPVFHEGNISVFKWLN